MTDQLEARLRAAADQAMGGVVLDHPQGPAAPPREPGRRRRWVTAAALTAAAAVVALAAWGVMGGGSVDPPQPVSPAPTGAGDPHDEVRAAVAATAGAPAWSATVDTAVGSTRWTHQAPDRFEMVSTDSAGEPLGAVITTGADVWTSEGGGPFERQPSSEEPLGRSAPLSALDGAGAHGPCAAREGSVYLVWQDPESGCGSSTEQLPLDLPSGSDVWVIETDPVGRVARYEAGEVPGQVGQPREVPPPEIQEVARSPFDRAGANRAVEVSFTYEDVPPITAPDR